MQDILFIKTSSLGDVIHHMPALTDARRALPEARFTWVVEDAFAPLARLHPAVNEVLPVASRRWRRSLLSPTAWNEAGRFRRQLRTKTYDKIIDTQGLLRTGIMAKLAQGERHGYDRDSIRERLAARFYDVRHKVARDQHAVARNRMLTALALGYEVDGPPVYGLDRDALAVKPARPYALLLHATAERRKEWAEENWIALGRALAERVDLLIPWGTEAERQRAERLAKEIGGARVPIHRALDDMARMIAGASFVVGVDTGLLHLAAALRVPLVGLFTSSEPGLTGPVGDGVIEIVGVKGISPTVAETVVAAERIAAGLTGVLTDGAISMSRRPSAAPAGESRRDTPARPESSEDWPDGRR